MKRRAEVGARTALKFPKCKECKLEKYLNEHGVCASCAKSKDEPHGQ